MREATSIIAPQPTTSHLSKMFSLSKPLQDCGVENHYKIGKALSSLMKTDCPYAHTKYVNEGRYPQWVYFVVHDEVERMPPMKEFFGPLMATLDGDSYASEPNGAFTKQSFIVMWEGKKVMGQVLNIVRFGELVAEKQGVSEKFWELLAPVVGGNKFNFRYLGEAKSPIRPNTKHVARRGHGKSPRKPVDVVEEETEEEKRAVKKAKKETPPAEAFQFSQPLINLGRHPLILRAKKWFERNHPFIKMDRGQDLFPSERARASAEAQTTREKKERARKIPAGQAGSQARRECDLNRMYDLEKVGRSGRCTYYQLHNRPPATNCKTSWFCTACKEFLHPECFYDYHRVRHGVILDLGYQINRSRSSRKMLKPLPQGVHKMHHVRQEPDYNTDGSVSSSGSQEGREDIPALRRVWDTRCQIGPDSAEESA